VNKLTVTAAVSDGGTLTYQWYSSATDSTTGGTEISGANAKTYNVPSSVTDVIGPQYYYCVVTNTNNNITGTKAATTASSAVTVKVTYMPWTAVTVTDSTFGSTHITAIAYGLTADGGGKFVAVGGSGKMAYSSNGTSWTLVGDSQFGSSDINGIAYGGTAGSEKFVAVGTSGRMAFSPDGIN
jgi:hypothetical protein